MNNVSYLSNIGLLAPGKLLTCLINHILGALIIGYKFKYSF